jgi:hypothetical protein
MPLRTWLAQRPEDSVRHQCYPTPEPVRFRCGKGRIQPLPQFGQAILGGRPLVFAGQLQSLRAELYDGAPGSYWVRRHLRPSYRQRRGGAGGLLAQAIEGSGGLDGSRIHDLCVARH